jgi:hypothetical protein
MVKDMVAQTSGMLTVIERAGVNKGGDAMWRCSCQCGRESRVRGGGLRRGETLSCGCRKNAAPQPGAIDMTGQRAGRLTVIERKGRKSGEPAWLCKCDCGNESTVRGRALRRGETKSCGCGVGRAVHGHARKGAVTPPMSHGKPW